MVITSEIFPFITMNIQPKESRIEVPSTSMAAHVFDEEVDIEHDNRTDIDETAKTENENAVAFQVKGIPLMLTPDLIPHSNYSQVCSSLGTFCLYLKNLDTYSKHF
jgi:hypothetical protein